MKLTWKQFEKNAAEFLNDIKKKNNIEIDPKGGADSKSIDIGIKKNGSLILIVEVKMPTSQIGQFVINNDESNNKFILSKRLNKDNIPRTSKILEFINQNYSKYKETVRSGKEVNCDQEIKNNSVSEYLNLKKINYIISCDKNYNFKIVNKSNFFNFFEVDKCVIRNKASGSQHIGSNVFKEVKEYLKENYECQIIQKKPKTEIIFKNEYSDIEKKKENRYFYVNNKKYYFAKDEDLYFIKKISNTANPTVIFTLKFLNNNIDDDRMLFYEDINK